MLYCGLDELEGGMTVAASVFHPRRPQTELLARGVSLDAAMLARLGSLGVPGVWVDHDLTADLDPLINPVPSKTLQGALHQLRDDFAAIGGRTVSAGRVQAYRQIVMELVCELIANRNVSGLTERLVGGSPSLFTHSANVAYLSISVGIELETYIVAQRRHMSNEHARDLTGLGVGALLHDIGKLTMDRSVRRRHEIDAPDPAPVRNPDSGAGACPSAADPPPDGDDAGDYRGHPAVGFAMLRDTRVPASARQIVLNHHQRWDGSGFPDMCDATDDRKQGVPRGEQVHVFSRIVAAANVLDNLLRAPGAARPVVAALHAFTDARFEGWFDPIVRDAMLRRVPPFPVGSRVVLSDGRAAVVVAPSIEQPCRPTVRLLDDGPEPQAIDLRLRHDLCITRCGGAATEPFLYELPEDAPLAVTAACGR